MKSRNHLSKEELSKLYNPAKRKKNFRETLDALPNQFTIDDALTKHWVFTGESIPMHTMNSRLRLKVKQGILAHHPSIKKTFTKVLSQ